MFRGVYRHYRMHIDQIEGREPSFQPRRAMSSCGRAPAAGCRPSGWLWPYCLGLGMMMVDTFVVNVALPAMSRDLDAGLGTVQWVVSGYVLTIAVAGSRRENRRHLRPARGLPARPPDFVAASAACSPPGTSTS
jgi:hypothetical protein